MSSLNREKRCPPNAGRQPLELDVNHAPTLPLLAVPTPGNLSLLVSNGIGSVEVNNTGTL